MGRTWTLLLGATVAGSSILGVALGTDGFGGSGTRTAVLAAVSTYDCPGGVPVGELHQGDRVLATGRDGTGDWLEVRDPRDRNGRVWVSGAVIDADGTTGGLDVVSCDPRGQLAVSPTTVPAGPTASSTTTTTTGAGGGGSTPPPADTTGPTIGQVAANPTAIWELNEPPGSQTSCSTAPPGSAVQSTVSAPVSDPSGIKSVTLSWQVNTTTGSKPMTGSGTYAAILGPFPHTTIPGGTNGDPATITVTITAIDNADNQRTAQTTVTLRNCVFF